MQVRGDRAFPVLKQRENHYDIVDNVGIVLLSAPGNVLFVFLFVFIW